MRIPIALIALVLPGLALAEPGYYRVTGVAADDTLNVRAAPRAGSADIGDLRPGTGGIEVAGTDPSGRWGRIAWQEGDGWVSMRFLTPDAVQPVTGTALPAGLLCTGTEPFWSLTLSADHAVYADIAGATHSMTRQGARTAEGRARFPVQLGHAGAGAVSNALIAPGDCSDGMSDRTYPWRVHLLLSAGGTTRYQVGCCRLPLETGSH